MEENRQRCESIRIQIDTKQGKIELLEREIEDRQGQVPQLNRDIEEAKRKYKNIAAEYGKSKAFVPLGAKAGRVASAILFGGFQFEAPETRDVVDALNEYNHTRFSNEDRINDLEREISSIGRDINNIQREKEDLVGEMRHLGCSRH